MQHASTLVDPVYPVVGSLASESGMQASFTKPPFSQPPRWNKQVPALKIFSWWGDTNDQV